MIRTARAIFLGRALREKLLLVAFIAIGMLWWGSAFLTRGSAFWRAQRTTTFQLKDQAQWIKNKPMIEETAKKTASRLEPTKTLNANVLVTTVLQLATEAGLKNTQISGSPTSTTSGQFAVHSQEFVIRNIDGPPGWEALNKFYESIQRKSPYIAMERFTLTAAGNNAAQLALNLKVSSVEILR